MTKQGRKPKIKPLPEIKVYFRDFGSEIRYWRPDYHWPDQFEITTRTNWLIIKAAFEAIGAHPDQLYDCDLYEPGDNLG